MKKLTTTGSSTKLWVNWVLTLMISLMAMTSTYSQDRNVSGIVTDEAGIPLPGVNIVQKGTLNGVTTDVNGKFVIRIPGSNTTLIATFIGYKTIETEVDMKNSYAISMAEEVKQVDEVVVVGYGVTKKSDLTGAVASVSGSRLTNTPTLRADQALQGKAAGVQIISNSGMPTAGITIKVRGTSSVSSQNTDPVVIIDGMPGSLNSINPNDIESLEVLKDASAQAIYGASGGNGVILITTKKGKSGKIRTDFDYYRGVQSPWKKMNVMNAKEFGDFYNKNVSYPKNKKNYFTNLDTLPSVDWQDEIFRQGIMEDYNLRVSGGSELATFMVSAGYGNMEGIVKETYLKKFNFRVNSDYKLSKKIKFGENVSVDFRKYRDMYDNSEYNSYVTDAISSIPATTIKTPEGLYNVSSLGGDNPVGRMEFDNHYARSSSLNANAYLNAELVKGLTIETRIGGKFGLNEGFNFEPEYQTAIATWRTDRSKIENRYDRSYGWTWQNIANYNVTLLDDYNLGLMAGTEASSGTADWISGTRYNLRLETEQWQVLDGSINDSMQYARGNRAQWRDDAIFGRLNFDYKGKYLITSTLRRDGSYKFGPNYRYGVFPSFSVGWKFSEEAFLKNQDILSFGKLRFGWGKTGNSNIEAFSYIPLVQSEYTDGYFFGTSYQKGASRSKPANPDLRWEAMVSSNLGADLSFLKNKISLTVDLFEKHNDGMLTQLNLPNVVGLYNEHAWLEGGDPRPLANIGQISNKGVEISLGYRKQEGELKFNLDFNITFIKTLVENITDSLVDGNYFGNEMTNLSMTKQGYAPYQFYGYKTNGIFTANDDTVTASGKILCRNQPYRVVGGKIVYLQSKAGPGDLRFVDVNGDSILDQNDMTFIGDPNPRFYVWFLWRFCL